jgi:hypothetical protein
MNKGLLATVVIAGTALAVVGSKLASKKNAAEKLTLSLKKLQIKSASFTDGILFKVFVSAVNPTTTDLSFTSPFIQIFLQDTNGNSSPIASSDNAKNLVVLKGRENTEMAIELRMPLMQALKVPKLLGYLISQFLTPKAQKTKKISVEYSTTAESINISGKSDFLI